jgi:predicted amidohydrolase
MGGTTFKLALIQMLVTPGDEEANLARAERLVAEAAQHGADVVLLPEAFHLGWTDPSARNHADILPEGAACQRLMRLAREHSMFVCAGIIERAGDRIFNSAILLDREGNMLLHHRKINELDIARELYAIGDKVSVADTEFGRVGLMICADAFPPGQPISRSLGLMGARIILSPSSWAVPADHDNAVDPYGQLWLDNYIPVAREYKLWIASASNVGPIIAGPWKDRKCIGCSMVIAPTGEDVLRGPYGATAETILYTNIQRSSIS